MEGGLCDIKENLTKVIESSFSAVENVVPMFDIILTGIEQGGGVIVDLDGGDLVADAIELAAAFASIVFAGDFRDDIHAIGDLTENRVTVVEERGGRGGDEKLGAIGIRTGVCHGEDAGCVMAQFRMKLIGKLVAWAASSGFSGISTLKHEAFNHAVECHTVVVAALREIEEVGAGEGGLGGVKGGADVTGSGVNGDFDVGHMGELHRISRPCNPG